VSTAQDHYWLARPTGPGTTQWANAFYPYGSTGQGSYLLHHGADIANPQGTPLLAPTDGTVIFAGSDQGMTLGHPEYPNFYGNAVIIELQRSYNGQPVFVLIGHMDSVSVATGQQVQRGDPIGTVGGTGAAAGAPHTHLEVRVGENSYDHTRNAEFWLEPLPGHGTIAGRVLTADGRTLPEASILFYPGPDFSVPRYYVFSYVDAPGLINPDDQWGENFLLADMPANTYLVEFDLGDQLIRQQVVVEAGKTAWLEVRTP
jgi:murein DD-endopeptidase MepM/ murein hydrolase activator NlpD